METTKLKTPLWQMSEEDRLAYGNASEYKRTMHEVFNWVNKELNF